jgi:hypothetical protein
LKYKHPGAISLDFVRRQANAPELPLFFVKQHGYSPQKWVVSAQNPVVQFSKPIVLGYLQQKNFDICPIPSAPRLSPE